MDRPIARSALYQEVAERLRRLIYSGDLAAGARVDEKALAARFGTSRTPLREALKVLHAEGLVRLDPRRGSTVAGELTPGDLDDLFPVMALLEGRCAYEAVRKAAPGDVARLEAIHARLEELAAARDIHGYYESNYVFHETIQELARNPWLSRIVSELRRFLRLLRGRQLQVPGRLQASLAEHRRIMRAVRRGDAEGAEQVMRAHLLSQRAALAAQDAGAARAPASRATRPRRRRRAS